MQYLPFRHTRLSVATFACLASASLHAQEAPSGSAPEHPAAASATHELPTVEVRAVKSGAKVYTREEMDATPQGNRDLTSLIADNPAVRLNPNTDEAGNRGSLAPLSFSIHGESPYQNQFLIDGISGTNIISPQNDNLNLQIGNVPGFSQAYNLDTDLLEQVRVYDSLVPVEFGKFSGGVIDARIKTPTGSNSFALKRSFNSSNLTQQRIARSSAEDWQNGEPGYSAVWRKHFTDASADIRLSERTSALIALSRRESEIRRQQRVMGNTIVGTPDASDLVLETRAQSDQADNLMAKLRTQWGAGMETTVLVKMADRKENLVSNTFADTAWTNRQHAQGLAAELLYPTDLGKLTIKAGYDQLDNLRESNATQLVTQRFATALGLAQYTYGGLGTESLKQEQTSLKVRFDLKDIDTGPIRLKVYGGLEGENTNARFHRPQDLYAVSQQLQVNGTTTYSTRTLYMAGTANAAVNSATAYLSQTLYWHDVDATLSVRADRDDLLGNTNVSPRARIGWDVFGNGQTQVQAGWARYFGLDLMGYALGAEKSKLQRNLLTGVSAAGQRHDFSGVRTPYSDESALQLTQQIGNHLQASLSLVHRDSRDGLVQTGTSTTGYRYVNTGKGNTDSITLGLGSTRPWYALAARWVGNISYSWQDVYRNNRSSNAWETTGAIQPDSIIEYNGQRILYKDLPALEFNQPRRVNLSFTGDWKQFGLTWGNRATWYSGKQGVVYLTTSGGIDRYASRRIASYWTWDTNVTYKPAAVKGLSLGIDVLNVLNRITTVAITNPNVVNNNNAYSTGREIWLTAGYAF